MRWQNILVAAVSGLSAMAMAAQQHKDTATEYSYRMAASIISRGQGIMTGSGGSSELLQAGFTQKAFTALLVKYAETGQNETRDKNGFMHKVRQYIIDSAESVVPFVGNATKDALSYPMDRLSNGNALLALSERAYPGANLTTAALRAAARALRDSIDLNRRNDEGGLWYYTYPYWSYLDGMYSLAPFYSQWALVGPAGNRTNATTKPSLDDMVLQLDLLWQHCHNETSGLLVHGYDASKTAVWADAITGASPHVWGRSLGWYAMALVDTLEILTTSSSSSHAQPASPLSSSSSSSSCIDLGPYSADILAKFRSLASAIIAAADPTTSAWWQVLDQPGREGNYIESSGSAMFAYALLKGSRLGYLDDDDDDTAQREQAVDLGTKATTYLTNNFVVDNGNGTLGYNGTVSVCSLNSTASYDYYIGQPINYNSVLGSAAYVLASLEVERLGS
ncbi:hypothetical protein PFICI_03027 [Pestalotiopsis fici W106-1]|uniref:Uncharacterized protein n=1 Tax=Pestalotiopsis fici (strain W106-1 / CGMCC3.15140) TaxID=1229662 RepID=W3XHT2_PESFW|nr:uncharacterized protein PFICI_03027 [Pestalotiopsis fici W106-1]ETS85002.1 hypothetical protein PFICI_03027 [Pestalotiopsis fici W106-1]